MKIEKYAAAHYYGYGFFSSNGYSCDFRSGIIAEACSTIVTESQWKYGSEKCICPKTIYEKPLCIVYVYDELLKQKNWREYFSGIELEEIYYDPIKASGNGFVVLNVDNSLSDIQQGLLFAKPEYLTADGFANLVSEYKEEEIKLLTEKLSSLQVEANTWYSDVCQGIKYLKEERAKKEKALSGIESNLEKGFGKYMRQPEKIDEKIEKEESEADISKATEIKDIISSEEMKIQNDLNINNKPDESADDNSSLETILFYRKQVTDFIDKNQWDLANIALEKLLPYLGAGEIPTELESKLYLLASEVYLKNKKYSQAIDCENRAIVCLPNSIEGYAHKTKTLEKIVLEEIRSSKNPSEKIEMLISSGKVWVDLAKQMGDNEEVIAGLLILAEVSEWGKKYFEAYQYSIEANKLDPEGHVADRILSSLNCCISQKPNEFSGYFKEKSPFQDEINQLIADMVDEKMIPEEGLTIVEKRAHVERTNSGREEDESTLVTYYLKLDGSFGLKKIVNGEQYYYPTSIGGHFESYASDPLISERDISIEAILCETDYNVYCERRFQNGNWSCYEWNSIAYEFAPNRFDSAEIKRMGCLKGKHFLQFLKDYIEKNNTMM